LDLSLSLLFVARLLPKQTKNMVANRRYLTTRVRHGHCCLLIANIGCTLTHVICSEQSGLTFTYAWRTGHSLGLGFGLQQSHFPRSIHRYEPYIVSCDNGHISWITLSLGPRLCELYLLCDTAMRRIRARGGVVQCLAVLASQPSTNNISHIL
jgi:hypothetical protein